MFAVLEPDRRARQLGQPAACRRSRSRVVEQPRRRIAKLEAAAPSAVARRSEPTHRDNRRNRRETCRAERDARAAIREKVRVGAQPTAGSTRTTLPGWLQEPSSTRPARTPSCCSTSSRPTPINSAGLLIPLSVPFVWLLFPFSRRFTPLRPHGLRHLLAVLHDAAGDRRRVCSARRLPARSRGSPVLRPAVPHVPPAARAPTS